MHAQAQPPLKPLRIVLADDHAVFRQGLATLLERQGFVIAGEAADGLSAVRLSQILQPDVVILDSGMPELNGVEAAREIHKLVPHTQTILLTIPEENVSTMEALRAGIRGYLYKSQTADELVSTIREVARGAIHFSGGIRHDEVENYANGVETDPLTERERQVLMMIASGSTNRDVAQALGLSPKTVESHRNRIMHKLNVHRAAELIRYAVRRNIIRA